MSTNTLFVGNIENALGQQQYIKNNSIDFEKAGCFFLTVPDNTFWGFGDKFGNAWSKGQSLKG